MSIISYKCPNCSGDLRFDPASQQYKCEYCISQFTIEELEQADPGASEQSSRQPLEQTVSESVSGSEQAVIYHCPSCGAEVVTEETTAATFCYYCHNPVVLKGRLEGAYLPKRIIPFKIAKEQAVERFLSDLKKKRFIPTAFFAKRQIEKITGVYFPYWVCDAKLEGNITGSATKVRTWRSGNTQYTETKHFNIARGGDIDMNDLTKNALKEANKKLIEGVQPFPIETCQPFNMGYLSGFQAQKRDIEKQEMEEQMHNELKNYSQKLLKDTVTGYTTVNVKSSHFQIQEENWDYVLLPVWTLTYRGKNGKIYYYAMNGATGSVYGELPIAYRKLAILFAAIMIPVLLLCLMGGYFL